jgi:hypothetical protein
LSRKKDDWDRRRRRLCSKSSTKTSARDDHINIPMRQVGRQLRQSIHSVFCPTIFDHYGLTFRVSALLKTTTKSAQAITHGFYRSGINKTNYWQALLLSASSKRPRGHTADYRNKLPASHVPSNVNRGHPTGLLIGLQ